MLEFPFPPPPPPRVSDRDAAILEPPLLCIRGWQTICGAELRDCPRHRQNMSLHVAQTFHWEKFCRSHPSFCHLGRHESLRGSASVHEGDLCDDVGVSPMPRWWRRLVYMIHDTSLCSHQGAQAWISDRRPCENDRNVSFERTPHRLSHRSFEDLLALPLEVSLWSCRSSSPWLMPSMVILSAAQGSIDHESVFDCELDLVWFIHYIIDFHLAPHQPYSCEWNIIETPRDYFLRLQMWDIPTCYAKLYWIICLQLSTLFNGLRKNLTHTFPTSRFLFIMSRKDQPRTKLSNEGWCEDILNQLVEIQRWNGSFRFWIWAAQPLCSKCCKDEEQYERVRKRIFRDHSSRHDVFGMSMVNRLQLRSNLVRRIRLNPIPVIFFLVRRTFSLICATMCDVQSGGRFHLFRKSLRNSMSQS